MNTSDYSHTPRTFVACSIICLMVLGQLAPLASAARKSNARPVNRSLEIETSAPATLAPLVPGITATLTDSFPDLDGDLKANPGETITYTATIVNSGTDARPVQFTNTIDPNTTLVGGSLKVSPLAFADTYVAAQNTQLSVGAPGVLTNDTGTPAPTAVPIAAGPTTGGGTVTLKQRVCRESCHRQTNPVITNNAGAGIVLAQNNRLHGLTVQNTTGTGLSGNGFGTLTVSENVILSNTTTAGVPINLNNGTLAATFRSISAGNNNANPDPVNGIVLTNTTGAFTVDGDGTNTSVGGNASGGTIQNMSGADGANAGNGVFLSSASGVTLRRMTISGTNQNHGIRGINSSNFTLEFSTVTGTNGTSQALDEGSVNFDNLTGSAAITSCLIEGGFEDNLNVVNTSGTLNRMTISGTTFGFNNTANGNSNILISSNNAGTTLNLTLKSSLIKGARADWISAIANSGSTMDVVIGGPLVADGNSFDNLGANAHPGAAAGSTRLVTTSVGNQTVDIRNNTLKGSKGEAMLVRATAVGAVTGTLNARVRNNTVGVAATANSDSTESSGIFLTGDGGSDINAAIRNNSVFQYNNHGIRMDFGDEINDGAVYNATVTDTRSYRSWRRHPSLHA